MVVRLKFLKLFPCLFILLLISVEARADIMEFIFLNKKYKENIKVEVYLITEDEICSLVKSDSLEKINQKSYKELDKKRVYLFVRLKNQGNRGAWGLLNCPIREGGFKINIPFMMANMDKWNCYLISLSGFIWPRDNSIPEITTKWERLYTK